MPLIRGHLYLVFGGYIIRFISLYDESAMYHVRT